MLWKKTPSNSNIVGDSWDVYTYQYGENLRAVISLDHTFIGDPQKLARVKQALEANGFQETYSSGDTLVMSKQSRLDLDEVFGVTRRLFLYSADVGVQYDGWGTAVES